jgi:hypothetical protein
MGFEFRPQPTPRRRTELPRLWWIGKKPEGGESPTTTYLRVLVRPEWLPVHWDETVSPARSRGCEAAECPPNWHALKAIDTGYAPSVMPVRDGQTGKPRARRKVLEVKWFQAEIFEPLLIGLPPYLIVVESKRRADGTNDHRVRLARTDEEKFFPPPEPPFEIRPTLCAVWSIPEPTECKPPMDLGRSERRALVDSLGGSQIGAMPPVDAIDRRSAEQILGGAAAAGRIASKPSSNGKHA